MHFHFQLANHYFAGVYRLGDIVAPIVGGLRELGHRVTVGILPDLPDWPSVVVMLEFFSRPGSVEEVLNWKLAAGKRRCLGLICTEDIDDSLVMEDPDFPLRRPSLLRLLPHCEFVWPIVPSRYDHHVPPSRLAFLDYGYVASLRRDPNPAGGRDIDVLFYATMNERRRRMREALERRGLITAATRGYLPDYVTHNLIGRSRLVLDMKRGDNVIYTSPSRICAALQLGATVVSERFDTSRLGALYAYTEACGYEEIEERCAALARAPDVLERGRAARERFGQETSMAANLRRAMDLPVFRDLAAEAAARP